MICRLNIGSYTIKKEKDISKETEEGLTPLDVAKFHKNEKIVEILSEVISIQKNS